jgi:hypothetical protein
MPRQSGKLEAFQPYLKERMSAGVWNARVLLRELQERGYSGGLHASDGLDATPA